MNKLPIILHFEQVETCMSGAIFREQYQVGTGRVKVE
jgi:hypothetical protein